FQLANAELASVLSTTGAGGLFHGEVAVTRWRGDATSDAEGYFVYVRDLDSGEYWSTSYQPTLKEASEQSVAVNGSVIEFRNSQLGIDSVMRVWVAPNAPLELRSCTITNLGFEPRRIELTSYAELVLQEAAADAAHLAFSKLFVETSLSEHGTLMASRRPRSGGEQTLKAVHFLAGSNHGEPPAYETDRSRFLGRGRDTCHPLAMQEKSGLVGALGSVLDPIFSLGKEFFLPPGESVCVTFALAAGFEFGELSEIVERYSKDETVEQSYQSVVKDDRAVDRFEFQGKQFRVDFPAGISPSSGRNGFAQPADTQNADNETISRQAYERKFWPATGGATETQERTYPEKLQFDNGKGGFSEDGTEYVIRLRANGAGQLTRPPMEWANIIANPDGGFIVSESGAGYTWAANSRLNRLTPWQNDLVRDPHSEALYLRDEEQGVFWSTTPGPVEQGCDFEVRHGFGYTKFLHSSQGLSQEVVQFVPRVGAVKVTIVRLRNLEDRPRRLRLFSYHQWALDDGSLGEPQPIKTSISEPYQAVFATNEARGVFSDRVAFAAMLTPKPVGEQTLTGNRKEFLGRHGHLSDPAALQTEQSFSGTVGEGLDPCAASQVMIELAPGETTEYVVLLGEAEDQRGAERILEQYRTPEACQQELAEVQEFWREKLSAVQIQTPSPALDLMVNGWLGYQNLSCRLWGRSSSYQSGGAYGFRDQLQDAAAWMLQWPELTREQILRNAAHQFVEGDVLHWWHPPQSLGIRTIFSDDLLWMPLFAAEYVQATGDESLWQEEVRFLAGEKVPAREAEVLLTPEDSGEVGTVYEHCCRALDKGLTIGPHGLPLMGCGDWNDGMNRVGQGAKGASGQGESVWLGFFIDYILERMLPVCEQFDDLVRLQKYRAYRQQLRIALNDAGWDGQWYRRAFFDDGTPLGTAEGEECQIDALVQAWSVMSGAAPHERAEKAMQAATDRLVDREAGLIQLLDPPFDKMPNDPGYIKGYLPGIRENGGQYTHGILWFIRAMAEMGKGTEATRLLEMISPVSHTKDPSGVDTYKAEPYVIAADVYSQPPHAGRAGWSWYTGSAGWMFRVAVESLLGITIKGGDRLVIDPRISAEWPECRVTYRLPGSATTYEISIENPEGRENGVRFAALNQQALVITDGAATVPLADDGKTHQVVVRL
ncbi:MAG: hypothetical protein RID07_16860, partial [Lacipirellulaceae bacterium]